MMVKLEHIADFRRNFSKGEINPEHVEIWVENRFNKTKDRKLIHSYINSTLIPELEANKFTIIKKTNIVSELIFIPKINLKSFEDIKTFTERAALAMVT